MFSMFKCQPHTRVLSVAIWLILCTICTIKYEMPELKLLRYFFLFGILLYTHTHIYIYICVCVCVLKLVLLARCLKHAKSPFSDSIIYIFSHSEMTLIWWKVIQNNSYKRNCSVIEIWRQSDFNKQTAEFDITLTKASFEIKI